MNHISETVQAAIGGVLAGATDRSEAMAMVAAPLQEMVAVMCVVQSPSVELVTVLHNRYGIDFVFRAGRLFSVHLN